MNKSMFVHRYDNDTSIPFYKFYNNGAAKYFLLWYILMIHFKMDKKNQFDRKILGE